MKVPSVTVLYAGGGRLVVLVGCRAFKIHEHSFCITRVFLHPLYHWRIFMLYHVMFGNLCIFYSKHNNNNCVLHCPHPEGRCPSVQSLRYVLYIYFAVWRSVVHYVLTIVFMSYAWGGQQYSVGGNLNCQLPTMHKTVTSQIQAHDQNLKNLSPIVAMVFKLGLLPNC